MTDLPAKDLIEKHTNEFEDRFKTAVYQPHLLAHDNGEGGLCVTFGYGRIVKDGEDTEAENRKLVEHFFASLSEAAATTGFKELSWRVMPEAYHDGPGCIAIRARARMI